MSRVVSRGLGEKAVTISTPPCDEHPPLGEWPMKNLILGYCPACGVLHRDEKAIGRMVRALQLIAER